MKASSKLMGVVCSALLTACGGSGDGDSKTGAQIAIIEDGIYNGAQSLTIRFSSGGTKPDPLLPIFEFTLTRVRFTLRKFSTVK